MRKLLILLTAILIPLSALAYPPSDLKTFHATRTDKATQSISGTIYITEIYYFVSSAGTSWTLQFKDKGTTPANLSSAIAITATTGGPVPILNAAEPIVATGGLDMITGGTTAGSLEIWVTYHQ